jgi:hypothetical protein
MQSVEIEILGARSTVEIEDYLADQAEDFEIAGGAFRPRRNRESSIGEVITIVGQVATIASFAKTLLEIYKLCKKSGNEKAVIVVKNKDTGQKLEIPKESVEEALSKILT